ASRVAPSPGSPPKMLSASPAPAHLARTPGPLEGGGTLGVRTEGGGRGVSRGDQPRLLDREPGSRDLPMVRGHLTHVSPAGTPCRGASAAPPPPDGTALCGRAPPGRPPGCCGAAPVREPVVPVSVHFEGWSPRSFWSVWRRSCSRLE